MRGATRSAQRGAVVALVVCALGCAEAVPPASVAPAPVAPGPRAMHYVFAISDDLEHVDATVCFEGQAPVLLAPGVDWGREALVEARTADPAGQAGQTGAQPLALDAMGIRLDGVGRDACVRYLLDLTRIANQGFELGMQRAQGSIVTNTALWLWRPPAYDRCAQVTVGFTGPAAGEVAVPWHREGDAYHLESRAFAFSAHAVFGRFARESVDAAGAHFDMIVLDGLSAQTREAIVPWIESAARAAALPNGRFPVTHAQIVVIPAQASGRPVTFGHATRGGERSIAFVVGIHATREALLADWVAVHEFSHLWWPLLRREDIWLSEGLATYYQEVLRARAGHIPATQAWSRLWLGAEKGRDTTASLAHESAHVFETFNFSRVYWGGAAIALLADIEIRRRSRGERSLDDAMLALSACCARSGQAWSARELIERMDAAIGAPVFAEIVARFAEQPRFPTLDAAFEGLGLLPRGETVELRRDAPDAWIRDAIMAPAK